MSSTLHLTQELLARPSVTPADGGCQELLAARLVAAGFEAERLRYGNVDNLWARRGHDRPVLCFAGHTDVVPAGPLEDWRSPPFQPAIRDGVLYGRGAADMKSGLAAMVTATEQFVREHPAHRGSIAFLLTSDEEGPAVDGTQRVMETLRERGQSIDWCIVGEPSSRVGAGDTVKIGRRGSLSGTLTVHGVQGHVAYPHLADNPVHRFAPALAELVSRSWDAGTEQFEPTTFQVSNLTAGVGAANVIPRELTVRFNLRYSPAQQLDQLQRTIEQILQRHQVRYTLEWQPSGQPFYSPPGQLLSAVRAAIESVTGQAPQLSTGGGTSDARFIAPTGAQVVELGVVNASIHKVNECVRLQEIEQLHAMYLQALRNLLA